MDASFSRLSISPAMLFQPQLSAEHVSKYESMKSLQSFCITQETAEVAK